MSEDLFSNRFTRDAYFGGLLWDEVALETNHLRDAKM